MTRSAATSWRTAWWSSSRASASPGSQSCVRPRSPISRPASTSPRTTGGDGSSNRSMPATPGSPSSSTAAARPIGCRRRPTGARGGGLPSRPAWRTSRGWSPSPSRTAPQRTAPQTGTSWSGCPDLNRGPLRPERSALTKLRHSPLPAGTGGVVSLPERLGDVPGRDDTGTRSSIRPRSRRRHRAASWRRLGHRRPLGRPLPGEDAGDASLVHLGDAQVPVPDGQALALFWDVPEALEEEPAERDVLAVRDLDGQLVAHVVDTGAAVDKPAVGVDPDDLGLLFGVELVVEVADQRFQQILHRED